MRYRRLLKASVDRLMANYVIKLGLREYERLISEAKRRRYQVISLGAFYNKLSMNQRNDDKYFLNRHDIDIDLRTARKMFEIEKKLSITSTFYFRLSTLDFEFMRKIKDYGSEVGYHFEEVASFAKEHGIRDKKELRLSFTKISELFLENLNRIEAFTGLKIKSVASHGDFANRSLGCANNEIIDEAVKTKAGIEFEAYELLPYFDEYLSDAPYPKFWRRGSPFTVMKEGAQIICLLTHPSNWGRNSFATTRFNLRRVATGIVYKYT